LELELELGSHLVWGLASAEAESVLELDSAMAELVAGWELASAFRWNGAYAKDPRLDFLNHTRTE
jgi:hypothetical protein